MPPLVLLSTVLQYGTTILPVIQQITGWIKDGKKEVTPEDIAFLIEFSNKKANDYLTAVGAEPPKAP